MRTLKQKVIPLHMKQLREAQISGSTRPSVIPKGIYKDTRLDLCPKGSHREGIAYHKTLSPVSTKDTFQIIMALVAHFDLELHQIDVKTTSLNGELTEKRVHDTTKGLCCEQ